MAKPTTKLRHVWRELNDGNADLKVLALQQWYEAEGWEHEDIIRNSGYWGDVPVCHDEVQDD